MKATIAIRTFILGLILCHSKLFSAPGLYTVSVGGRYHYVNVHKGTSRAKERRARFGAAKKNKQEFPGLTCKQVATVLVCGSLIAGGLMQWCVKQVLEE